MSNFKPRFNHITYLRMLAVAATLATISLPAYACSIPKSYYKHVSCTANNAYFLAVKDSGDPVGLLNSKGKKVVDLSRYSHVDVFQLNEGLLPVQRGDKVGYVNMSGREVVPAIYDVIIGDTLTKGWARPVNNNRIIVKKKGNFGIIDGNNKVILSFSSKYQTIGDYESGTAKIVKNNGTIWVDRNARKIAPPKTRQAATSLRSANTNMATAVNTASAQPNADSSRSRASSTPKPSSTANNARSNSRNNAPISVARAEVWQTAKRDGKWGFVSRNDVPMINFAFDDVTPFSEGLAGVKVDDKWGFVDLTGQLVIPFRFDDSGVNHAKSSTYKGVPAFTFKRGKAWIGNLKDGAKLCIDKKGNNVSCGS